MIRVAGIPIKIFGEMEENGVPVVVHMGGNDGTPVWSGFVDSDSVQRIHDNPTWFLEELIKEVEGLSEIIGEEAKKDLNNKLFLGVGKVKQKRIIAAGIPINLSGERKEGEIQIGIYLGEVGGTPAWSSFVGSEGKQWIEENLIRFMEELIKEVGGLYELIGEEIKDKLEVTFTIGSA